MSVRARHNLNLNSADMLDHSRSEAGGCKIPFVVTILGQNHPASRCGVTNSKTLPRAHGFTYKKFEVRSPDLANTGEVPHTGF